MVDQLLLIEVEPRLNAKVFIFKFRNIPGVWALNSGERLANIKITVLNSVIIYLFKKKLLTLYVLIHNIVNKGLVWLLYQSHFILVFYQFWYKMLHLSVEKQAYV